jgi:dextranase
MKLWRGSALFLLFLCFHIQMPGESLGRMRILDVCPDKARYAPGEPVTIRVVLQGPSEPLPEMGMLKVGFSHLGEPIGPVLTKAIRIYGSAPVPVDILWRPPDRDFTGYFVDVRLTTPAGQELARSQTAVDVSSEWNRYPRYGYLAHYSSAEGARPEAWIADLNEFHIDGLQFYDFQNRHEQPLAGSVAHPDSRWLDIAGRDVERDVLNRYLAAARQHNMTTMAYDSSYSAYADAFTNGSGVRLQWATWNTPDVPRTLKTAKAFNLPTNGTWKTHRLIYMDESSLAWQNYLFGRMAKLFQVYPFDGWHIDTFGTRGAYAFDGSYVDFISGFRPFVDRASETLHKRVVLNNVGTLGQEQVARSKADFVYSELWEQNETYDSILTAADRVHTANPGAGLVFAAYLHRSDGKSAAATGTRYFSTPSVLLTDAVMFAAGASHIELGDGKRMLSSDYFPNDMAFLVSPVLHAALRHYYDFLTAYENILRYDVAPLAASVELTGWKSSADGAPNTIWHIGREKGNRVIVHLINLLGSSDDHWRDVHVDRPDAPFLHQVRVRVYVHQPVISAGWATPDYDGGRFHELRFTAGSADHGHYIEVVVPSLKYWDVIVLKTEPNSAAM